MRHFQNHKIVTYPLHRDIFLSRVVAREERLRGKAVHQILQPNPREANHLSHLSSTKTPKLIRRGSVLRQRGHVSMMGTA
jgi:hypothetical protein